MLRLSALAVLSASVFALSPVAAQAFDLNPLSMIKGAVEAAVEDRKAGDIAKDTELSAKITAAVIDEMGADVVSISADVYEQDVMLTGVVEKAAQKTQAGILAKGVQGVKMLYNDIRVIPDIKREKGAVEGFVDDTVIESKINALLLDAKGVNVTNFRYRSVGGHVYLFGRALSNSERSKAKAVVKDIENVQSVTSRVKVRALP